MLYYYTFTLHYCGYVIESYITVVNHIRYLDYIRRTQLGSKTVSLVDRWCCVQLITLISHWKPNSIGRDWNLLFIQHCNHFNENEYRTVDVWKPCSSWHFRSIWSVFFHLFFLSVTDNSFCYYSVIIWIFGALDVYLNVHFNERLTLRIYIFIIYC